MSKDSFSNKSFGNLSNPNITVNKFQINSKRKKSNILEFPCRENIIDSDDLINGNPKKTSFTNRNQLFSNEKKKNFNNNKHYEDTLNKYHMYNNNKTNLQIKRTSKIKNTYTKKSKIYGDKFHQLRKNTFNSDNSSNFSNNHEQTKLNFKDRQGVWIENREKKLNIQTRENSNLIRINDRSDKRYKILKKNYKDFNELENSFENQIISQKNKKIVKLIKKKDNSTNSLFINPDYKKKQKMEDSEKYNYKVKRTLSDNTSLIHINNFNNKIMMNNNIIIKDDSHIKYYKSQFFLDWRTNLKQDSFSFEITSQDILNKDKNDSKNDVLLNNHLNRGNKNKPISHKLINSSLNQISSIKENEKENLSSQKLNSKLDDKISTENSKDYNIQINLESIDSKSIQKKLSEKINNNNNSHIKQENSDNDHKGGKNYKLNEAHFVNKNVLDCKKVQKVNENSFIYIIIDDNLYIRNCLKRLLDVFFKNWKKKNPSEKIDIEILEGADGIDALKYVIDPNFSSRIKGIFIDENMEYLNGSEAVKIIRRFQNLNKISKLFQIATVTAFEDSITKSNILSAGVDEIYQKPIEKRHIEDFFKKFPIKKN